MHRHKMDDLIKTFFDRGYSYDEIRVFLSARMSIDVSYRQLKRHLQRLGLRRRGVWDIHQIQAALEHELQGSGRNLGCRSMCQRLRSRHGMSVGRNLVLSQLRILDPDGVESRRIHRLTRIIYHNNGPNYLVHVDGYDKIKRYGLAIHGAIDGYSRKVLWLRVNRTNNDPKVIASYFLDFVSEARGTPRCLRMDAGTENGVMANMQKAFRWFHGDEMAGEKSVLIGSSPSNQRIESWWRRLHEMCIAAWQETLSELESTGFFSTANNLHIECVRFCFTQIIQKELDIVRQEWNDHEIRRQNRHEVHGKPYLLYDFPDLYGTRDYLFPVDMRDVAALRSFTTSPSVTGCDEPIQRSLFELLQSVGKSPPETMEEAKTTLQWFTSYFQ